MKDFDLRELEEESPMKNSSGASLSPLDEAISFLPFETGDKALICGPVPPNLFRAFSERYRSVNSIGSSIEDKDYDNYCNPLTINNSIEGHQYNAILLAWPSVFYEVTMEWLRPFINLLVARGQIMIIDCVDRPAMPEQELTCELFGLWASLIRSEATKSSITPEESSLPRLLSECGATHPRAKVFTDPDLIAPSSYWLSNTERLLNSDRLITRKDENLLSKLRTLYDRMLASHPATPPLQLVTATAPGRLPAITDRIAGPQVIATSPTPYIPPIEGNEGPGERLRIIGADYLRSSELLSILLQPDELTISEGNHELIASKILSEYGSRALTAERNPGRMAELLGVSIEIASRVVAILELGRRFFEETNTKSPFIRSPEDAFKYLKDMAYMKKEHLRGLYLNIQSRLIHDEVISIGTLSRSLVHPREVFAPALEHSAYALILAHNHPSGDLSPSAQDITVTKNIAEAGRTLGIELLDHVIIGVDSYLSLRREKVF